MELHAFLSEPDLSPDAAKRDLVAKLACAKDMVEQSVLVIVVVSVEYAAEVVVRNSGPPRHQGFMDAHLDHMRFWHGVQNMLFVRAVPPTTSDAVDAVMALAAPRGCLDLSLLSHLPPPPSLPSEHLTVLNAGEVVAGLEHQTRLFAERERLLDTVTRQLWWNESMEVKAFSAHDLLHM